MRESVRSRASPDGSSLPWPGPWGSLPAASPLTGHRLGTSRRGGTPGPIIHQSASAWRKRWDEGERASSRASPDRSSLPWRATFQPAWYYPSSSARLKVPAWGKTVGRVGSQPKGSHRASLDKRSLPCSLIYVPTDALRSLGRFLPPPAGHTPPSGERLPDAIGLQPPSSPASIKEKLLGSERKPFAEPPWISTVYLLHVLPGPRALPDPPPRRIGICSLQAPSSPAAHPQIDSGGDDNAGLRSGDSRQSTPPPREQLYPLFSPPASRRGGTPAPIIPSPHDWVNKLKTSRLRSWAEIPGVEGGG